MEHALQSELWRDLFVMLGTSAAALIGLLFIVSSLHLDETVNNPAFRLRARNNTIHLVVILVEINVDPHATADAHPRGRGGRY